MPEFNPSVFFCPCCRKSYPVGSHSELDCVKAYVARVLAFTGDLTAREIGNLPRLRNYPKASVVKILPQAEPTQHNTPDSYAVVHVGFHHETISAEDRREHEEWIRMIAQRKEAVNLIRGRV